MSLFEIAMLVCFGSAWPFSIYRSYTARRNAGKSLLFLLVVFVGYLCGSIHKFLYARDLVTILYVLNGVMVAIDIGIYWRNNRYEKARARSMSL